MKNITAKALIAFILFMPIAVFTNLAVSAQETTTETNTDAPILPIGEEQDPNKPEDTTTETTVSVDTSQQFINGLIAGALIGVVGGGVIAWLFKDKFYK